MKRLITLICTLGICQLALAQKPVFNHTDSTLISGKIIGYDPKQTEHFITFITYDIYGSSITQSIQIEDDGKYWVKLYQPFEGDMQLQYKSAILSIYTSSKQPLILDIYDAKLSGSIDYSKAFIAKGDLAKTNNLMFQFKDALARSDFATQVSANKEILTDSAFSVKKINRLNLELAFLDAFIKANRIADPNFNIWQRNYLNYELGKEILMFPFMGKFNKDITLTQLLKLIHPIPINNDSALRSSSYYSFLNLLQMDINIITSINPQYETLKLNSNRDEIVLDEIDKFSEGLTKEILYITASKGKINSKKDNASYLTRLGTTINNSFLKERFTGNEQNSSPFKKFDIIARLNALKVNPLLKKRLTDLFTSYNGTSLHIDFWGDWCPPCMSELPNYPKLITAFKDKPIKFLFLSVHTSEKSMLEIKEKLKINGDFVNLNNDEVKILTSIFGFQSYPSHFVVNSVGEVVDRASRLSASSLQNKIKEIEKLVIN